MCSITLWRSCYFIVILIVFFLFFCFFFGYFFSGLHSMLNGILIVFCSFRIAGISRFILFKSSTNEQVNMLALMANISIIEYFWQKILILGFFSSFTNFSGQRNVLLADMVCFVLKKKVPRNSGNKLKAGLYWIVKWLGK